MSKMATRWILIFTVLASLSAPLIFSQEAKDRTLDASQKQAIVDEVSNLLNQKYIFVETAKKMEEQILGRLKNGDYDKLAGAREFAQGVSQDLSFVSKDKHLGFAFAPERAAEIRRIMSRNEEEARAAREKALVEFVVKAGQAIELIGLYDNGDRDSSLRTK